MLLDRNGVHMSDSDPFPHATIAAATEAMRERHQYVVVHARMSPDQSEFIGSVAYVDEVEIKQDSEELRASYRNPIPIRASLLLRNDGSVPVSHITTDDGRSEWYIFDGNNAIVYLDSDVFFHARETAGEEIRFWNPILNKICCAHFLETKRPPTPSPEPQPSNLEAATSDLDTTPSSASTPTQTVQWVKPKLKLDHHKAKPVAFSTQSGDKKRTGWERWKARPDHTGWLFVHAEARTGIEYWAERLPVEEVRPTWVESTERPIQFANQAGEIIKTARTKWVAGQDDSFFVHLRQDTAYLMMVLPSRSE